MKQLKITRFLVAVLLVFTLVRCATSGSDGNEAVIKADSYELLLYSAPWCENCKPFIKDLNSLLQNSPPAGASRMATSIHVVTGLKNTSKPTQAIAEEYVTHLGVPFDAVSDYWRTGTIKNYYDITNGPSIPAAVLIGSNGQVKVFDVGPNLTQDVYSYLSSVLK